MSQGCEIIGVLGLRGTPAGTFLGCTPLPCLSWDFGGLPPAVALKLGIAASLAPGTVCIAFYLGPRPGLAQTGREKHVLGCFPLLDRCAFEIADFYSTWINLIL